MRVTILGGNSLEKTALEIKLKDYLNENIDEFDQYLLNQAVNIKDKINDILRVGDIDLINDARKLHIDSSVFAKLAGIACGGNLFFNLIFFTLL